MIQQLFLYHLQNWGIYVVFLLYKKLEQKTSIWSFVQLLSENSFTYTICGCYHLITCNFCSEGLSHQTHLAKRLSSLKIRHKLHNVKVAKLECVGKHMRWYLKNTSLPVNYKWRSPYLNCQNVVEWKSFGSKSIVYIKAMELWLAEIVCPSALNVLLGKLITN